MIDKNSTQYLNLQKMIHKNNTLLQFSSTLQVKGMFNDQGQRVEKAEPGTAVEIMGWRDLPSAGDEILQVKTEVCQ